MSIGTVGSRLCVYLAPDGSRFNTLCTHPLHPPQSHEHFCRKQASKQSIFSFFGHLRERYISKKQSFSEKREPPFHPSIYVAGGAGSSQARKQRSSCTKSIDCVRVLVLSCLVSLLFSCLQKCRIFKGLKNLLGLATNREFQEICGDTPLSWRYAYVKKYSRQVTFLRSAVQESSFISLYRA